jgi:dipeptidyl aminopeptidase/acylaminoacyl peptidase
VRNPRWSPDGTKIGFLAAGSKEKPQIHVLPVDGGEAHQITKQPQGVESFEWAPGGEWLAFVGTEKPEETEGPEKHNRSFEVDGVLVYPPDFEEGHRYPLVLTIHGGPMSVSTEAFDMRAQVFAARGWLVFSPNYRGSVNLGRDFQRAVVNDAGAMPAPLLCIAS